MIDLHFWRFAAPTRLWQPRICRRHTPSLLLPSPFVAPGVPRLPPSRSFRWDRVGALETAHGRNPRMKMTPSRHVMNHSRIITLRTFAKHLLPVLKTRTRSTLSVPFFKKGQVAAESATPFWQRRRFFRQPARLVGIERRSEQLRSVVVLFPIAPLAACSRLMWRPWWVSCMIQWSPTLTSRSHLSRSARAWRTILIPSLWKLPRCSSRARWIWLEGKPIVPSGWRSWSSCGFCEGHCLQL
mmetsp:Transcript_11451/g.25432  ORF Transcript_11451/g.25432 Transcript_11451/m.25432 type:complete len:241 (+) Transcript_11451:185-907(+)